MRFLAALLLAAIPSGDGLSAFAGDEVRSPDGRWTVTVQAVDPHGERMEATARLKGPGVDRPLMRFERHADIVWRMDAGRVMLVERTLHFSRIGIHRLDRNETADPLGAQRGLERAMAATRLTLGTVENRRYALSGFDPNGFCVVADESGLPPGRDTGAFLERRGAFRVTYAGTVTPVRSCPAK